MTKDEVSKKLHEAENKLRIIKAFSEGHAVQFNISGPDSEPIWEDLKEDATFAYPAEFYRIKPVDASILLKKITAFSEGQTIQINISGLESIEVWEDLNEDLTDSTFYLPTKFYRIKPVDRVSPEKLCITREEAAKKWHLIKEFSEGKILQFKRSDGTWIDLGDEVMFDYSADLYRIKPEYNSNKDNKS